MTLIPVSGSAVLPTRRILALVRGVAENLCLRTQLKDPQPDHPYIFSGAKTVATFNQLNADLLRCAFI